MLEASGNPKTPQFATGALGAPKANIANKSVTDGWSGRGDLNARPPAPKALDALIWASIDSITCGPCLLGLVETLASYNMDCKAAIRLVKPPTIPTGSPAGSADCEINQRGRAHVVTAGSLKTPSIAGFKLGAPPLLLRQAVLG